jgi:hypothetical protein
MTKLGYIWIFVCVAAGTLGACYQTSGPYGQAPGPQYARTYCGDDWKPCQPPSTYKQHCWGNYLDCGYDSARNRTDGNPNN